MSTTYYLDMNVCPHCKKPEKTLRIGASSQNRVFLLNIGSMEESGIALRELSDWQELWSQPNTKIRNDEGQTISPGLMFQIIANRVGRPMAPAEVAKAVKYLEDDVYYDSRLMMHAYTEYNFGEFGRGTYQLIESNLEA